jgi:asparagine synthase (glutamine-hydrolysing)
MCAILGIASVCSIPDKSWLSIGRDTMFHRGPDDYGEWWSEDSKVGFAHRRLSIVELSTLGHQPMHFFDFGLTIVFNGEIYNHNQIRSELSLLGYVFRSRSDTEVLLAAYAAWDVNCLDRLNGVFSFVIFDSLKQKLFIARDRAGEKPFFYRLLNGTFQFASELKALLNNPNNPRHINAEAMDCFLSMGYVPGDRCILQGYNKLPPAHAMFFDLKTGIPQIWKYWNLPEFAADNLVLDEDHLLNDLETLLEDAVCGQLVADVPVGVLLSGGVDSSLVTAMAVRASNQVRTFTIGFPGHIQFDETEHARLIARHFGTHHTELFAEDASVDLLPILARQYDEPIMDSSIIPTFLVSQLVRQHCTVALGGDGGDELFGGYSHYSRLLWMHQKLSLIPYPLRRAVALSAEKLLPVGLKGRNWAQGLGYNIHNGLPLIASYFDDTTRRRLLNDRENWPFVAESVRKERVPKIADILQRATQMDFANYLVEDILVKVDRASMLNSLEMRAPLLDYRLIEFAFGKVPSRLKSTATEKKILLKRLTTRILPREFDQQRKQGFSIPLNNWLKAGTFKKFFNEVLRDPQCSFDAITVDRLLRGQANGHNNGERLFGLVLFELWRREYKVTL